MCELRVLNYKMNVVHSNPMLSKIVPQIAIEYSKCGSAGKESTCNAGDLGSIPGLGRSPGEGIGYPLQYSGLESSIDCIDHGVAKSQTQLRDFHCVLKVNLNQDIQMT